MLQRGYNCLLSRLFGSTADGASKLHRGIHACMHVHLLLHSWMRMAIVMENECLSCMCTQA